MGIWLSKEKLTREGQSEWANLDFFFLLRDSPIFELSPKVGFQNVENCWNHVASLQFPSLRSWNIYCKKCNLNFCWSCFPSGNPPDGEFPADSWGEIFTPCFPSSLPFIFSTVLFIVPWHSWVIMLQTVGLHSSCSFYSHQIYSVCLFQKADRYEPLLISNFLTPLCTYPHVTTISKATVRQRKKFSWSLLGLDKFFSLKPSHTQYCSVILKTPQL